MVKLPRWERRQATCALRDRAAKARSYDCKSPVGACRLGPLSAGPQRAAPGLSNAKGRAEVRHVAPIVRAKPARLRTSSLTLANLAIAFERSPILFPTRLQLLDCSGRAFPARRNHCVRRATRDATHRPNLILGRFDTGWTASSEWSRI